MCLREKNYKHGFQNIFASKQTYLIIRVFENVEVCCMLSLLLCGDHLGQPGLPQLPTLAVFVKTHIP